MNKINKKKLRQRKKNAKLRKKQEIVNLKRKLKLEKLERENIENKLKEINVPKKVKKNRNKNKKARKAFLGGMNDDIEQKLSLKETEFGIMKIQESANETSNQWLFTSAEKARGLRTKTKGITQSLEGKSGITWFLTKLKILKILSLRDGRSFLISRLNIDYF